MREDLMELRNHALLFEKESGNRGTLRTTFGKLVFAWNDRPYVVILTSANPSIAVIQKMSV